MVCVCSNGILSFYITEAPEFEDGLILRRGCTVEHVVHRVFYLKTTICNYLTLCLILLSSCFPLHHIVIDIKVCFSVPYNCSVGALLYQLQTKLKGVYRIHNVCPSLHISCKRNFSKMDEPILMKHSCSTQPEKVL